MKLEPNGTAIYFDMPAEEYHSGPGISSSVVKRMAMGTPAEALHEINSGEIEKPHLVLGTVTHALILEPEKLERAFLVVPKFERRSKADKERWAEYQRQAKEEGKILVREGETEQMDLARGMRDAVFACPDAAELLKEGQPEVSLYARDRLHGELLRSREDWMPAGENIVVDLKTARDAGPRFAYDAWKLGYHISAHHYRLVRFLWNLANGGPRTWPDYRWITVCPNPPHLVSVYEPDDDMAHLGEADWRRGMYAWIECNASGLWPGLPPGVKRIGPPAFALRDAEAKDRGEDLEGFS